MTSFTIVRWVNSARQFIAGELSTRLLLVCIGLYLAVAALVTLGEVALVSVQSREDIEKQIDTLATTFVPPIAQALWNFDQPQLDILLQVLADIPAVGRVRLNMAGGASSELSGVSETEAESKNARGAYPLLGSPRSFRISRTSLGRSQPLGELILEPSLSAVWHLIKNTILMEIVQTLIVVALLSMILFFATTRFVRRPLRDFAKQISGINPMASDQGQVLLGPYAGMELAAVAESFNALLAELRDTIGDLRGREREIQILNTSLESRIATSLAEFKKLEVSQAKIRAFVTALPDIFFTFNREGRYLEYQAASKDLLIDAPDDFLGKLLTEVIPESGLAERLLACIRTALEERHLVVIEYEADVAVGRRYFEGRFVPLDAERVILVARDITEAKRQESLLRASNEEKEVLLREVHHRVKNNLQVISSLVSLQDYSRQDDGSGEMRKDTQVRISSMAHLHELLYGSKDLSSIDPGEYIEAIVSEMSGYSGAALIHVEAQPDVLSMDEAMPFGIIVTELLTNALKYAYPAGKPGRIVVSYTHTDRERRLIVRDEGVGPPSDMDPATSVSLGFTLVRSLAKQIGGKISVCATNPGEPCPGLSVALDLPLAPIGPG